MMHMYRHRFFLLSIRRGALLFLSADGWATDMHIDMHIDIVSSHSEGIMAKTPVSGGGPA